ncbi:MAG: tape measure protein [Polaromonas sp.]
MATNPRDVELGISVKATGDEEVKKLQASVLALAKEGGAAAPEFEALANQIGRLGEQQNALTAFQALSAQLVELTARQQAAAAASEEQAVKLKAAADAATQAKEKQAQAAQQQADALASLRETNSALAILRNSYDANGDRVADYKAKLQSLVTAKEAEKAALNAANDALKSATAEVKTAVAAENALETAYGRAGKQADAAAAAVKAHETVLRESAAAAETLGTSTDDLAAAQARIGAAFTAAERDANLLRGELTRLSQAEDELAAQTAFEKQAADAAHLVKAGEYVRFWETELQKAENQVRQTAEAATAASNKIETAFSTLGVRSAQALEQEIRQVRSAMDTLAQNSQATGTALSGAFAAGEARIAALQREVRELNGTLTTGDKVAKLFANSMGQIAAGNIVADGVGYLVNKVKELGAAFLATIVQGDQLQRGLMAIYKDAGTTAAQIEFLRRSSSESGVAFSALSTEFVKFSAAMQSANIPLQQSNDLFKAVTAASASLGLRSEETAGALNALGQMASKGTVSLEELRQQLGDRLPGAMGLTAKGLGITEAQLIKLVESGGLATRDFIVPFTTALGNLKGETDGLVPTWERFKGVLAETAQGMGDAGVTTLLTGALKVLGMVVGGVTMSLSMFVEAVFLVGSGVVALAARLSGDAKAWEFFGEQVEKSTNRLTGQGRALAALVDPTAAATVAMTTNTSATVAAMQANTSLAGAQKLAALSTALAGDASLDASAKIVQYNVAAAELLKSQEKQTEAYGKSAKAAKDQGDTLVALAKLSGDAAAVEAASTAAAELHATALDKVAKSQAEETVMLVAQKAELEASRVARGLTEQQIKTQADALDQLILKSRAETEQALQASAAAKGALFERQLTVEKLKDHSAALGDLKTAMEAAAATLREYERLSLNGKKTDDDVTAARLALTRATALYKDGLADAIANIDLETRAKQANLQLSISLSGTAQKHSELLAAQARALGDTTMATYYDIKAKEQSIATIKLEMQMRALEAEAALKTIELKRLEITGSDELSKKKLALLDIEAALIKVKLAGNEAAKETIRGIEDEISRLRDGTSAWGNNSSAIKGNTGARYENSTAMERQNDAQERLNASVEKADALERKRLNIDKSGFSTDSSGNRLVMGSDVSTLTGIVNFLKSAGVDDPAAAKAMALEFSDGKGDIPFLNNAGQVKYGGRSSTMTQALLKAAETYTFGTGGNGARTPTTQAPSGGTKTVSGSGATDTGVLIADYEQQLRDATARNDKGDMADLKADIAQLKRGAPSGGTRTVNINLGGRTTRVNVASQSDSDALTAVLRQLESGQGTAA